MFVDKLRRRHVQLQPISGKIISNERATVVDEESGCIDVEVLLESVTVVGKELNERWRVGPKE